MSVLTCKICGFKGQALISHITKKHGMSGREYKSKFDNAPLSVMRDSQKKLLSEINKAKCKDPSFIKAMSNAQKNGGSIFTVKYWNKRGLSDDAAKLKIRELQIENAKKSVARGGYDTRAWMSVGYWTTRGMTELAARAEISRRQSILSAKSSKFAGHRRDEKSKKKLSASMSKKINEIGRGNWAKHFGKFNGRSKVEVEFYEFLKQNVHSNLVANIPVGPYIVDILHESKIIEFYGDFWHANPTLYTAEKVLAGVGGPRRKALEIWEKDKKRVDCLTKMGYRVLVVWEQDWKLHKEKSIERIKKFLYDNTQKTD